MKHWSRDELKPVARVVCSQSLSKRQRLLRWAYALERHRGRLLRTFRGIEHEPRTQRLRARMRDSPLSVAAEDPVLSSAGLHGDSFGEAVRFFRLSHWQLHALVCACHFGESVAAETIEFRVRRLANRATSLVAAFAFLLAAIAGAMLLSAAMPSHPAWDLAYRQSPHGGPD
ncbi:hypothetical protein AUC68_10105 [Methyloceanibacter methanicus]|uniref:Uncharacterized protein n=1 Tax=Methyloceanibacter methanicus TaxID=1774968 RepID=A0A1E3VWH8_9HYPH|nr:hypothetical protein AUC68_10105 [Methyloceanibacter methanicus]